MGKSTHPTKEPTDATASASVMAAFRQVDIACMFGPSFFLDQLGHFVREQCPAPEDELPLVQVTLADGDTLDVCHIRAVSLRWVMFAVQPSEPPEKTMVTEFVPYELIRRVRIRPRRHGDTAIGFAQGVPPELVEMSTN